MEQGMNTTAVVNVNPREDVKYRGLLKDVGILLLVAEDLVVATTTDVKIATDNLGAIADRKKFIEGSLAEYVGPIQQHIDDIKAAFKALTEPLAQARLILRDKIGAFHQAERDEADRLAEIARMEQQLAAAKGEPTPEATPVAPEPPAVTRGEHTQSSERLIWKYEVVDFTALDDKYKVANDSLLGQVVRGSKGTVSIPGIRIFQEPIVAIGKGR
jgi:hypothetical protein